MYSASTDLRTKTVIFSGTILDYQVAFTGRSSMLTLSGILAHCGDDTTNYVFTKANIEWVGGDDLSNNMVDGKSKTWIDSNYENEDVCAIIVGEGTNKKIYYNPGRIFKRIIHKYNGDLLGTTKIESGTSSYTGTTTKNSIKDTVWNFFTSYGFSKESTAAIMGNIEQESSFNPAQKQVGGPAAGLFQWENYKTDSGRFHLMKESARQHGKDWTDVTEQCKYALSEMSSCFSTYSGPAYPKQYSNGQDYGWSEKMNLDKFKQLTDITQATKIFEQCFERASIPRMDNRIKYATEIYNTYTNSNITTSDTNYIAVTQNNWRNWRNWKFSSRRF